MPPKKTKVEPASVGLAANEVAADDPPAEVAALAGTVEADGGAVLATYRDPFGETLDKMLAKADKFDASKITAQDLAKTSGGSSE